MDGRSLQKTCQPHNMQDALNGPSSAHKDHVHPGQSPYPLLLLLWGHRLHAIRGLLVPDRANAIQELFGNSDNRFLLLHPPR